MADTSGEDSGLTLGGLTRRERLERIASAERDRRGGHEALAMAAIGEPNEWPARVVLALARLSNGDEGGARRLLEEGLDVWARETGLPALDAGEPSDESAPEPEIDVGLAVSHDSEPEPILEAGWAPLEIPEPPPLDDDHLERPFDSFELDRAFEEAEAQTDEMHDVNRVAARVLMDEPVGLAELSGHSVESLQPEPSAGDDDTEAPRSIPSQDGPSPVAIRAEMDAAFVAGSAAESEEAEAPSDTGAQPSRAVILATLERWLHNLERRSAGGAR